MTNQNTEQKEIKEFTLRWRMEIQSEMIINSPTVEEAQNHVTLMLGRGITLSVDLHGGPPIQFNAKIIDISENKKSDLVVPGRGEVVVPINSRRK